MEKEIESDFYIRDYKIIEKIGFGAHGLVYKSIKKDNNKIFVIKQIPLFKKNINIEEAKNEASILKKINCKFIVKYYESFEENNTFNIIMEYCEKGTLSSLISTLKKKNKHLKENQIWNFFIQISIGLSYLHNKKILHRDLKTKNIFLTKNLNIKIGDLGIAKILKEKNHTNTLIGTPFYLSPEICEEKPYNEKSDIWALGCILYELITFKHPYNATNQAALLLKIINGNYEDFNKEIFISDNLKKMVELLLEKNYLKRPSIFDIINNSFFIEKCKEFGFYDFIVNFRNKIIEDKKPKVKQIIKINNLNSNKRNSYLNHNNKKNIEIRNRHLNYGNKSRRDNSSITQNTFSTSNIRNEKKLRMSSIEYMHCSTSAQKIIIRNDIKNINNQNKNNNLSKLNGSNLSLKKVNNDNYKNNIQKNYKNNLKKYIRNTTFSIKKVNKSNLNQSKNSRINSSRIYKYYNKKPKVLDKIESNTSKLSIKNLKNIYKSNSNKSKMKYINTYITNNEKEKIITDIETDRYNNIKNVKEKIKLKQKNISEKFQNQMIENNLNKENKNNINFPNQNKEKGEEKDINFITPLNEKKENDSFEIIEPSNEKKIRIDTLSNITEYEEAYFKKSTEFKDESESNLSLGEEKVFIINNNNNNFKNNQNLIKEKYEGLKNEIYNYNNLIDCNILIDMFNNIDKNYTNKNMEETLIKVDNYIKLHLPNNLIPQFKKIFNKLCFYNLQLKYLKMQFQET